MNMADKLREGSNTQRDNYQKVIDIIVADFQKEVDAGRLDEYVERDLQDKDALKKRCASVECSFWLHHDGCSGTHFRIGNIRWKNPDVANEYAYECNRYLGVDLYDIQARVVGLLACMAEDRLKQMGFFPIQRFDDTKPHLGYKTIRLVYHW